MGIAEDFELAASAPDEVLARAVRDPMSATISQVAALAELNRRKQLRAETSARAPEGGTVAEKVLGETGYADGGVVQAFKDGSKKAIYVDPYYEKMVESYIGRARGYESGGDRNARPINKKTGKVMSSATGLYQLLEGTRKDLDKSYGFDPADRSDETELRRMRAYTGETLRALQKAGIPVTPGTLYGGHLLGQGGVQKFYKAYAENPDAPVESVFSEKVISVNPDIFNPKGKPPRKTLGEIMQKLDKVGGGRQGTPRNEEDLNMGAALQVAARRDRGDTGPGYEDGNLGLALAYANNPHIMPPTAGWVPPAREQARVKEAGKAPEEPSRFSYFPASGAELSGRVLDDPYDDEIIQGMREMEAGRRKSFSPPVSYPGYKDGGGVTQGLRPADTDLPGYIPPMSNQTPGRSPSEMMRNVMRMREEMDARDREAARARMIGTPEQDWLDSVMPPEMADKILSEIASPKPAAPSASAPPQFFQNPILSKPQQQASIGFRDGGPVGMFYIDSRGVMRRSDTGEPVSDVLSGDLRPNTVNTMNDRVVPTPRPGDFRPGSGAPVGNFYTNTAGVASPIADLELNPVAVNPQFTVGGAPAGRVPSQPQPAAQAFTRYKSPLGDSSAPSAGQYPSMSMGLGQAARPRPDKPLTYPIRQRPPGTDGGDEGTFKQVVDMFQRAVDAPTFKSAEEADKYTLPQQALAYLGNSALTGIAYPFAAVGQGMLTANDVFTLPAGELKKKWAQETADQVAKDTAKKLGVPAEQVAEANKYLEERAARKRENPNFKEPGELARGTRGQKRPSAPPVAKPDTDAETPSPAQTASPMGEMEQYYRDLYKDRADYEARAKEREDRARSMAILKAGLAIAGGKSQYFTENLKEALPAIKEYEAGRADIDADLEGYKDRYNQGLMAARGMDVQRQFMTDQERRRYSAEIAKAAAAAQAEIYKEKLRGTLSQEKAYEIVFRTYFPEGSLSQPTPEQIAAVRAEADKMYQAAQMATGTANLGDKANAR